MRQPISASGQGSFFGLEPTTSLPSGFRYNDDFLSAADEIELVKWIETLPLKPFEFHGYQGLRRIASFGFRYDYSRQVLDAAAPISGALHDLRERAATWIGLEPEELGQVLVSEYAPGAPIGWHKDKSQFDQVVGVSLLAPATFRLRRKGATGWERRSVVLEPRSIYLLSGAVRNEWQHSIPPMERLRYSITLRSLISAPRESVRACP